MPLYQFISEAHGVELDLQFPVDARPDEIVLRRRTVPARVGTITGARPPSMGESLAQGYRKLEEQGKLKDAPGYLPIAKVKAALAQPD
ncbi:hypothetical protein [Nibricoccus sp. IMCC34717]|uniref:hypothetical protein n=1 Tax=Nibricoccus sp. IMCC34717 TaxID=3034021 RepID=UPI00384BB52D